MSNTFDLVVIGSGPGGFKAAIQAAKLGKKVALVESGSLGGNCVVTGTIPSKSLREAALTPGKQFAQSMEHMRSVVSAETKVITNQLERNKVQLFSGAAEFVDSKTLKISPSGVILHSDKILIATGSSPHRPEEFPFDHKRVLDSDSLLSLQELPKRLLVVGAGVIGCEYASIFAHLGSQVTILDRRKELLRCVDDEVMQGLAQEFQQMKMDLLLGATFDQLKSNGDSVSVNIEGQSRVFDYALICMGRVPNSISLKVKELGVKMDGRNFIQVDRENFQSSVPGIFAVGDVIGPPSLAASSAEQGRIASAKMFGHPVMNQSESMPYGIYTIPEISNLGALESDLKQKNIPYVAGRAYFRELARGLIVGDRSGFVKLLVHKETRKLLGVHIIGHGACDLIHIGQTVLALEAPIDFIVNNTFNYPTFAEAYKVAALDCVNRLK